MAKVIPSPSGRVAARYRVDGTALVCRDARLSPVEIGDTKQPDFKPQIKIPRWDKIGRAHV